MKIRSEASVISSTGILQVLLIAILYSSFIYAFKEILQIYGEIEIRIGTFVPVLGGILFGVPGAIGAVLGNLILYFIYDTSGLFAAVGSLYDFFIAYGIFRLWYSGNSRNATFYISDSHSCLKFIKIISFNAINMSVLQAGAAGYLIFGRTELDKLFIEFANSFDYPLILGIPILCLWVKSAKTRYVRFKDDISAVPAEGSIVDRI